MALARRSAMRPAEDSPPVSGLALATALAKRLAFLVMRSAREMARRWRLHLRPRQPERSEC
jgi:hypothetical protein